MKKGKVYLVGAGPGAPELITLKAKDLLRRSEVVIYDYLVNKDIVKFAKEAKRIAIAPNRKKDFREQNRINKLLEYWAKKNKLVVRLKGGDPFIFSRGSEEALYLNKSRIPFEIIPGITSGIAACESVGIPITHRNLISQVLLITGHEAKNNSTAKINYKALVRTKGTLIFYMAIENIGLITKRLIKAGLAKGTSCCAIQNATLPNQKVVFSRLEDITAKVKEYRIKPPSIFVVSKAVDLRSSINSLPLYGKRVVITRPKERQSQIKIPLQELGAKSIEFSTIRIVKKRKINIPNLSSFDWSIFISSTSVEIFFNKIKRLPKNIKIACIGAKTASSIEKRGYRVNLIPSNFSSQGLKDAFNQYNLKGKNILILRSDRGNKSLANYLRKKCCFVQEVILYKIKLPNYKKQKILKKKVDMVIFTCSQGFKNFIKIVGNSIKKFTKDTLFVSIGPVTSKAIRDLGFRPHIEARIYTIDGIVEAIENYFRNNG